MMEVANLESNNDWITIKSKKAKRAEIKKNKLVRLKQEKENDQQMVIQLFNQLIVVCQGQLETTVEEVRFPTIDVGKFTFYVNKVRKELGGVDKFCEFIKEKLNGDNPIGIIIVFIYATWKSKSLDEVKKLITAFGIPSDLDIYFFPGDTNFKKQFLHVLFGAFDKVPGRNQEKDRLRGVLKQLEKTIISEEQLSAVGWRHAREPDSDQELDYDSEIEDLEIVDNVEDELDYEFGNYFGKN